jgi:hypothetical protein
MVVSGAVACGENVGVVPASGEGHRSDGSAEDVFESVFGVNKFLDEFHVVAMRKKLVAPAMCANDVTLLLERAEIVRTHVAGAFAGPTGCDEESSFETVATENRSGDLDVGNVTVVEGDLRH